jgi:hypothetical protein
MSNSTTITVKFKNNDALNAAFASAFLKGSDKPVFQRCGIIPGELSVDQAGNVAQWLTTVLPALLDGQDCALLEPEQAEAPLIEMHTLEKGFAVSFPFALKDNFRAAFPSAKWNPYTKHWVVGPRSGKRLEQWIAATEGAAQAAAHLDQVEYDQAGLAALETELAQVEADLKAKADEIEALGKQKRTLAELRAALDASKEALVHVEMEAEAAQAEVEAEKAAIDALLEPIVNRSALEAAIADMARHHQSVGAKAREAFDEAQAIVIRERNKLRAAGWYNEFIEDVADANFNRPDRDNVRSISKAKWYKMRPYEQD